MGSSTGSILPPPATAATTSSTSIRNLLIWILVLVVVTLNLLGDLGGASFPEQLTFVSSSSISENTTSTSSSKQAENIPQQQVVTTKETDGSTTAPANSNSMNSPPQSSRSSNTHQQEENMGSTTTNNRISKSPSFLASSTPIPPACIGKEHLVEILISAKLNVTEEDCLQLPTWNEVVDLYGPEPIIHGLETCELFQNHIVQFQQQRQQTLQQESPSSSTSSTTTTLKKIVPKPLVAGFCNTGTNALAKTLRKNLGQGYGNNPGKAYNIKDFDVPWGKHHRVVDRKRHNNNNNNKLFNSQSILPIILIRDPYRWMSSMCKSRYFVDLPRGETCWHLVEDNNETKTGGLPPSGSTTTTVVRRGGILAHYKTETVRYESLPDLWNHWNREYYHYNYEEYDGSITRSTSVDTAKTNTTILQASSNNKTGTSTTYFPRLFIRYEDMIFHPATVVDQILTCAGIPPSDRKGGPEAGMRYQTDKAKSHGAAVGLVQAMVKYGTRMGRRNENFRPIDLEYIRQTLDPELMMRFGYHYE